MIVRALTSTSDWTFGKGKNDYVSANAAVRQAIQTRLSSFLGDCYFDSGAGIDWFNLLGSKNEIAMNLAVSATILNTPDSFGNFPITRLKQLSIKLTSNRKLTISYTVNTVYTGVQNPTGQITANTSYLLTESGSILTTEDGSGLIV